MNDPEDAMRALESLPTQMMVILANTLPVDERREYWLDLKHTIQKSMDFVDMKIAEVDGMSHVAGQQWPDTIPEDMITPEPPTADEADAAIKDARKGITEAQLDGSDWQVKDATRKLDRAIREAKEPPGRYPWENGQ